MYYLTEAGVKFIQEGLVKAKNKAKKRKWVKKEGRKDTGEPSLRAIVSTRKAARHGQDTGAATVVSGRERLARK